MGDNENGDGGGVGSCLGAGEREAREEFSKFCGSGFPEMEQYQVYFIAPRPYSEPRQTRFQI